MLFVELLQQVELLPLFGQRGVIVLDVLDQLLDLGVLRIDVSALVNAGQEAGLPVLRFLDRITARAHGDEARQILVLGAESVSDPRTHARPNQARLAAIHQQQRRFMVRHIGMQERMTAMSSMFSATCGKSSLTSMPLWPYFWNLKGEESRAGFALGAQIFHGQRFAGVFLSAGLGSNVSTCEGPPLAKIG